MFKKRAFSRGLLVVTIGVLAFSSLAATGITPFLLSASAQAPGTGPGPANYTNQEDCIQAGFRWNSETERCEQRPVVAPVLPDYHYSSMTLANQVLSFATATALYDCLWEGNPPLHSGYKEHSRDREWRNALLGYAYVVTESNVRSGTWFGDGHWAVGSYLNPATGTMSPHDGRTSCNDVVKAGINLWGFTDGLDLLCTLSNEMQRGWNADAGSCRQGTDEYFDVFAPGRDSLIRNLMLRVYSGRAFSTIASTVWSSVSDSPGGYLLHRTAFEKGCSPRVNPQAPATHRYENVPLIDAEGNVEYVTYEGLERTTNRYVFTEPDTTRIQRNCASLVHFMGQYADSYEQYRIDNKDEPVEADIGYTPGGLTGFQSSCTIPNLGWMLCPVLELGANLADSAYGFLADSFLAVRVDLLNTDPSATNSKGALIGTGTYTAWGIMRNFANVAFIIVFLITIFSQLTSVGVSNYGVKKILPRLIIGAVLVNVSFFICQIMIDLSNLGGYGIRQVFDSIATQVANPNNMAPVQGGDGNFFGIVTTVIAAASIVWLNLGALVVAAVAGIIALLSIFLLLVVRLALIVLLTVVAPLAFVAYLLPNTEPLFKRWLKMFGGLLMVFPMVGLLFGASSLASAVLQSAAPSGDDGMMMKIIAYIVLVVPLLAVFPLLKGSIKAAGNIGAVINGLSSKLGNKAGSAAGKGFEKSRLGQFKQYRAQQGERRRALSRSGIDPSRGGGKNPLNWGARVNRGANKASGKFGSTLAASGAKLSAGIDRERTEAAESLLRQQITSGRTTAADALQEAVKKGDTAQARAAQNIMFGQGSSGVRDFRNTMKEAQEKARVSGKSLNSGAVDALRQNITDNHGQMVKSKAADIITWAGKGGDLATHAADPTVWQGMSQSDLATQTADTIGQEGARKNINPQTAAGLLANDQLNGDLDQRQIEILTEIAGPLAPATRGSTPATELSIAHTESGAEVRDIPLATDSDIATGAGTGAGPAPAGGGSGPGGMVLPGDRDFTTSIRDAVNQRNTASTPDAIGEAAEALRSNFGSSGKPKAPPPGVGASLRIDHGQPSAPKPGSGGGGDSKRPPPSAGGVTT